MDEDDLDEDDLDEDDLDEDDLDEDNVILFEKVLEELEKTGDKKKFQQQKLW